MDRMKGQGGRQNGEKMLYLRWCGAAEVGRGHGGAAGTQLCWERSSSAGPDPHRACGPVAGKRGTFGRPCCPSHGGRMGTWCAGHRRNTGTTVYWRGRRGCGLRSGNRPCAAAAGDPPGTGERRRKAALAAGRRFGAAVCGNRKAQPKAIVGRQSNGNKAAG